jgi:methyl-accepting chemotaxis protein
MSPGPNVSLALPCSQAAAEAAKAGEHGKGFSVVAQEVKNLAEQSKQATAQVRTILNDIQRATSSAVKKTELCGQIVDIGVEKGTESSQAISHLAQTVNEAYQAALQISATSQQQMIGVDQVKIAIVVKVGSL